MTNQKKLKNEFQPQNYIKQGDEKSGDHDAKPVVDNGDGLDEDCRCHVGATDVQQKL